jgi:hypothetical protein
LTDEQRELLMAHDALVCRKCGNLQSVCSNPDLDWHPHTNICYPTATAEWGVRRLQAKHEKKDHNDQAGLHPLDGVSVFTSQFAPAPEDDEFA